LNEELFPKLVRYNKFSLTPHITREGEAAPLEMCLRLAEENGIPKFLLISIPTESHVTTACFCNMCKAIDHFHYNIVE